MYYLVIHLTSILNYLYHFSSISVGHPPHTELSLEVMWDEGSEFRYFTPQTLLVTTRRIVTAIEQNQPHPALQGKSKEL